MLDIKATVEAMQAAGMAADQILIALTCVRLCPMDVPGLSQGHERDSRREAERERKRLYREKLRNSNGNTASEVFAPAVNGAVVSHGLSQNVPGTSRDSPVLVSPAPLPLILEKTVEKEVLKKKVKGSGIARASRLPDDFVPDETCEAIAREHQFTRAHWQRTIDGFRDYWKSQPGGKGLKADWQATCRNWLRREADNMKGPGNGTTSIRPKENSIKGGLARVRAVIDAEVARGTAARGRDNGRQDPLLLPGLREGD